MNIKNKNAMPIKITPNILRYKHKIILYKYKNILRYKHKITPNILRCKSNKIHKIRMLKMIKLIKEIKEHLNKLRDT